MKVFVSGLVNVETNLKIRSFPVAYYPIDYPFFGIKTNVSGVGYNITEAARTLGDDVTFVSMIGKDDEAKRIAETLDAHGISRRLVFDALDTTPISVVLREPSDSGRRQIYCDLKDVQEKTVDPSLVEPAMAESDVCVLCNVNFNRALLPVAKRLGKKVATDVHVINDVFDPFNRDFMKSADILFLSDEDLPSSPEEFIAALKNEYSAEVMAIGLGADGVCMYERATDKTTRIPAAALGGVVNTVGAGDALFTAFVHYYGKYGAAEAMKRAEVFAALKIRADGGSLGFSTEEQVEKEYAAHRF